MTDSCSAPLSFPVFDVILRNFEKFKNLRFKGCWSEIRVIYKVGVVKPIILDHREFLLLILRFRLRGSLH
jgi:hypothetical protein